MTAPDVHARVVLLVSHPVGFRGSCTCGNYTGPRQGARALAERDADAHVTEATRCRRRVFQSRDAAERYAVDRRQRTVVEATFCKECRGWHLISLSRVAS